MAPTALAVSRMNRRRETAALSAGWPSSNGEEIVWLADLRAKRDAARPDGDWGFIMKSNHPGSGVVVKLRMEENPRPQGGFKKGISRQLFVETVQAE